MVNFVLILELFLNLLFKHMLGILWVELLVELFIQVILFLSKIGKPRLWALLLSYQVFSLICIEWSVFLPHFILFPCVYHNYWTYEYSLIFIKINIPKEKNVESYALIFHKILSFCRSYDNEFIYSSNFDFFKFYNWYSRSLCISCSSF